MCVGRVWRLAWLAPLTWADSAALPGEHGEVPDRRASDEVHLSRLLASAQADAGHWFQIPDFWMHPEHPEAPEDTLLDHPDAHPALPLATDARHAAA
jgi:hypothetical protein